MNILNFIITIIRFIANLSEIIIASNNNWIIDSAVNAYIIFFKNDLRLFIEQDIDQIKEFDGKLEIAQDKDSITLTDSVDNRIILNDIYYILDNQDRILSLMKFRREHKTNFYFIDPEIFIMNIINDFRFIDISINDILYTTISQI